MRAVSMTNRWAIGGALLAAAVPAAAQFRPGVLLFDEGSSGAVVRGSPGTVFTVVLQQASGINYRWRMMRTPGVELTGPPEAESLRPGMPGGPVRYHFTVRVTARGEFPAVFVLAPGAPSAERRRVVTLLVDSR